eukprot:TRINITY_DN13198_c0_g1_i1.p1 TRINITY_DN13198_c0_g1~~TRINITY_DN13198_c0_g1_i1.p1  ORF type:complete len:457 (-),score=115.36 TRINITY_DN13198_c0_g1_i1:71-1441(-)
MLPKLDPNGGRGSLKDHPKHAGSEAVVALPRLRLLKQVGVEGEDVSPVRRRRNSPRLHQAFAPAEGEEFEAPRRGRGILRPLGDKIPAPSIRSPSPLPQARPSVQSLEDSGSYMPHNEARQRVRQHNRQRRRRAKEEEELRLSEERERSERIQRALPQVEAHRREIARRAAENQRREKAEKDSSVLEKEQLASARRERLNRYTTPDAINEHLRACDEKVPERSRQLDTQDRQEKRKAANSSAARRATPPPREERDSVVTGSFGLGSLRGRHRTMLSPRQRGTRSLLEEVSAPSAEEPEVAAPEVDAGASKAVIEEPLAALPEDAVVPDSPVEKEPLATLPEDAVVPDSSAEQDVNGSIDGRAQHRNDTETLPTNADPNDTEKLPADAEEGPQVQAESVPAETAEVAAISRPISPPKVEVASDQHNEGTEEKVEVEAVAEAEETKNEQEEPPSAPDP